MGLFDMFKSKNSANTDHSGPSADYMLAHYALRQLALDSPVQMLGLLASPEASQFLTKLLQDVEKQLGHKASYTGDQIRIYPCRIGEYPCAIVEFPTPQKMAEAYMVAIVALLDPQQEMPEDLSTVEARYYTLEKGFSTDGSDRTVLCAWDKTAHKNYGDGPVAQPAAFALAVETAMQ
jgi:hypothetical protein